MAGRWPPSNSMSTTGPMTWTTFPTFVATASATDMCLFPHRFRPLADLGARNDLDDLARDRGLPDLVHLEGQRFHHLARVARRRIHRRHLRGKERGIRLEQRSQHL